MTLILIACVALAQDEPAVEEADALFGAGRYAEALEKYEAVLKAQPDHRDVLFNSGMAAFFAAKHERAAELWERLRKLVPDDLKVLAKLVQAYQALKKADLRDAVRKDLLERRAKLSPEERRESDRFCRDQFDAGKQRVMAWEYFELAGDRPLRYRFSIVKDGKEEFYLSLGSYEITTQVARESGRIGKDERMFHLDGYFNGGRSHKTYGFFTKEPSYDDVRQKVADILEGKRPAISGTEGK